MAGFPSPIDVLANEAKFHEYIKKTYNEAGGGASLDRQALIKRLLNTQPHNHSRQQVAVVLSSMYRITLEAHHSLQKKVDGSRRAAASERSSRGAHLKECQVCFSTFHSWSASSDELPSEPVLQMKRTLSDTIDANEEETDWHEMNLLFDDSDEDESQSDSTHSGEEDGGESSSDSDAEISSAETRPCLHAL